MEYTKKLYQDALDVQNACNSSGVIGSLARAMPEIAAEISQTSDASTTAKNRHPVVQLYLSKLCDLAGGVYDDERLSAAFEICEARAKGMDRCPHCGSIAFPDVIQRRECCPKV